MRAAHHGGGRTLASKGCMTRTETCETRNPRGDRDKKTYEFKDRYGVVTRVRLARRLSEWRLVARRAIESSLELADEMEAV